MLDGNHRTGKPIYCSYFEEEGKAAEETFIEDMGLYQGQKLYYLFDFGDMWEFGVGLIKIKKGVSLPPKPVIIKTKGGITGTVYPVGKKNQWGKC